MPNGHQISVDSRWFLQIFSVCQFSEHRFNRACSVTSGLRATAEPWGWAVLSVLQVERDWTELLKTPCPWKLFSFGKQVRWLCCVCTRMGIFPHFHSVTRKPSLTGLLFYLHMLMTHLALTIHTRSHTPGVRRKWLQWLCCVCLLPNTQRQGSADSEIDRPEDGQRRIGGWIWLWNDVWNGNTGIKCWALEEVYCYRPEGPAGTHDLLH